MFRSFITIATLLATGAHGFFGCCWHHEHADRHAICDANPAADPQETVVDQHCGCRHSGKTELHNREPQHGQATVVTLDESPCDHPHHHDSGQCDEGHCQYLVDAKVELPSLDGDNVLPWLIGPTGNISAFSANPTGLQALPHLASLLSGSLCVRDLTQIARI